MYDCDYWPKMPDGSDYDGKQLLSLVRDGNSPFHGLWDVNLLVREIEKNLGAQVIDVPVISKGSNNYVSWLYLKSLSSDSIPRLDFAWHIGSPRQAVESTRHRSTSRTWRCQHAGL